MKEPTKYSMSTGLPDTEKNEEVKKYPLQSIEQELHSFIEDSKDWIKKQDKTKKE